MPTTSRLRARIRATRQEHDAYCEYPERNSRAGREAGEKNVALGEQGAELDPGDAGVVDTASYFLITGGLSVSALLVLATSLIARRSRLLPGWLTSRASSSRRSRTTLGFASGVVTSALLVAGSALFVSSKKFLQID